MFADYRDHLEISGVSAVSMFLPRGPTFRGTLVGFTQHQVVLGSVGCAHGTCGASNGRGLGGEQGVGSAVVREWMDLRPEVIGMRAEWTRSHSQSMFVAPTGSHVQIGYRAS